MFFQKKPPLEEFWNFNRELSSLARSGLPISQGLKQLSLQVKGSRFKTEINKVQEKVENGESLSNALEECGDFFSPYYISLIKAGERSGNLSDVLSHLTKYSHFLYRSSVKIKTGLLYPLVEFCIAIPILWVILVFVVPKFEEIYHTLGGRLPAMTQLTMMLSYWVNQKPFLVLLFFLAVFLVVYFFRKIPLTNSYIDYLLLCFPVLGRLQINISLFHYCEVLGFLLKEKIPITDALEIAARTTPNLYARDSFRKVSESVRNGNPLSVAMGRKFIFPRSLVWAVSAAEKQEKLDVVLEHTTELYMDVIEDTADRLAISLQPILIFFIGLMVGYLIISLYLPIFKIGGVIR